MAAWELTDTEAWLLKVWRSLEQQSNSYTLILRKTWSHGQPDYTLEPTPRLIRSVKVGLKLSVE